SVNGDVLFNFDDVEGVSFKSSGSESVQIYLDGMGAIPGSNGLPFETDLNGHFDVQVPIGQHFLEFRKNGHTFANVGRYPAAGTLDFQADVNGIQMLDNTTHLYTGKVVGGTFEGNKPVGMNRTVNNIGKAQFTLASEDLKIVRLVVTDSLTGEYQINLPPKKYNSTNVDWVVVTGVPIELSSNITPVDLGSQDAYDGVIETDSVFDTNDSLLSIDSSFYNVRRDFIHRVQPELVVQTVPDKFYSSSQGATLVNVDLRTLPFETYTARKVYGMKMNAVEIYQNLDNLRADTVKVTDGTITINNGFGTGFVYDSGGKKMLPFVTPEVLTLNNGELDYKFVVTEPNITAVTSTGLEHLSFTQQMSVNLSVVSFNTPWPNAADPTENYTVYVLGGKPVGSNFVTKSPEVVDFILRDPPGSNSYALMDQTTTTTKTEAWNVGGSITANGRIEAGFASNTSVGFLGCANEEVNTQANGFAETNVSFSANGGEEYTTEVSLNTVFQTNGNPIELGMSDLFVAKSQNLETGVAVHVVPVALADCGGLCHGDTMFSVAGDPFRMTRMERVYVGPFGGPTQVAYTQNHIVNVLIPDLIGLRNTFLTSNPKYISAIPVNNPLYGTNNDDPQWGITVTTADPIRTEPGDYSGSSYVFTPTILATEVDSVRWMNQQVRLWKEALADNEIEKWRAIQYTPVVDKNNVSIASGVTLTQSKTHTTNTTKSYEFELSASHTIGAHASASGAGVHLLVEASLTVGVDASYSNSQGVSSSTTTGYQLLDEDEGDSYSIDIYPGEGSNAAIFSIVAGQTSCPHEDKLVMEYTTPEYIQRQIDVISVKAGQLQLLIDAQQNIVVSASSPDVILRAQTEKARLIAKQSNLNVPAYLTQLKNDLLAGEVLLGNATQQRDKPSILINGAQTAQIYNVPADQTASLTLTLKNESETFDNQIYAVEVLDGTNPFGLTMKIDGQVLVNATDFLVPGAGSIQKILTVDRGPSVYDYTNVGIIIHSTCQYDLTSNGVSIVDTVYFDISFLPTCTDVEIISPDD
ncbi:MAG: hypothetical protein JKY54_12665, partial [Flavobacteriales bacterium]|nr:hypothetical protein [Flavobacteriales bacterium]